MICWVEIPSTRLSSWKGAFNIFYALAFTLVFSSLLKIAFLIFLSSVPFPVEIRGFVFVFVFLTVESDLFFHSWKFIERKCKETEEQEIMTLT